MKNLLTALFLFVACMCFGQDGGIKTTELPTCSGSDTAVADSDLFIIIKMDSVVTKSIKGRYLKSLIRYLAGGGTVGGSGATNGFTYWVNSSTIGALNAASGSAVMTANSSEVPNLVTHGANHSFVESDGTNIHFKPIFGIDFPASMDTNFMNGFGVAFYNSGQTLTIALDTSRHIKAGVPTIWFVDSLLHLKIGDSGTVGSASVNVSHTLPRVVSLPNSGVSAGTGNSVTVNSKGIVTAIFDSILKAGSNVTISRGAGGVITIAASGGGGSFTGSIQANQLAFGKAPNEISGGNLQWIWNADVNDTVITTTAPYSYAIDLIHDFGGEYSGAYFGEKDGDIGLSFNSNLDFIVAQDSIGENWQLGGGAGFAVNLPTESLNINNGLTYDSPLPGEAFEIYNGMEYSEPGGSSISTGIYAFNNYGIELTGQEGGVVLVDGESESFPSVLLTTGIGYTGSYIDIQQNNIVIGAGTSTTLADYANDAAAGAGGVPQGGLYQQTGTGIVMIKQ